MYNIMIADDDRHIRDRLKNGIDWASLGLTLCGEAADGDEAINLYELFLPPIVIMDIHMPNRDGLEVARDILIRDPEAIIICITGFNDFEYAQTAVKLGIYDMFTKPLDMLEIQTVLKEAVNHIEEIKKNRQDIEKLNALAAESLPILQRTFLERMLDGICELPEPEIFDRLERLNIDIRGRFYSVALISPRLPELSKSEFDMKLMALSHTSEELIQASGFKCVSVYDSFNCTSILISWNDEEYSLKLDDIFSTIRNKLLFYFNLDIYVGIGGIVTNIREINTAMMEAQEAIGYRYLFAQNNIVNIKNVIRIFNKPSTNYNIEMGNIIGCFKDGNLEKLSQRLNELVAAVASASGGNNDGLRRIFIELTVLVVHMASDIGVDADEILGCSDPYKKILQMPNMGELIVWFKALCQDLLAAIDDKKGKRTNRIISLAKRYIDEHFTDSNMSLISISEHVELSSVYFCQLFHNESGIRLSEYVNSVRINRAKELLKNSNLKIYEIAYNVGYNNPKYFNYIFKKQTGVTPNDYRQSIG
jgi:two-component system response regulator YesN